MLLCCCLMAVNPVRFRVVVWLVGQRPSVCSSAKRFALSCPTPCCSQCGVGRGKKPTRRRSARPLVSTDAGRARGQGRRSSRVDAFAIALPLCVSPYPYRVLSKARGFLNCLQPPQLQHQYQSKVANHPRDRSLPRRSCLQPPQLQHQSKVANHPRERRLPRRSCNLGQQGAPPAARRRHVPPLKSSGSAANAARCAAERHVSSRAGDARPSPASCATASRWGGGEEGRGRRGTGGGGR